MVMKNGCMYIEGKNENKKSIESEVSKMNKLLRNNKGFSLVELLIALLIMAVIAAVAITLFGGVLQSSKSSADKETAENIKRQLLTYINISGDEDLSTLGVTFSSGIGTANSQAVINYLTQKIRIASPAGGRTVAFASIQTDGSTGAYGTPVIAVGTDAIDGDYGPFLDGTKILTPAEKDKLSWTITYNTGLQRITVVSSTNPVASSYITVQN